MLSGLSLLKEPGRRENQQPSEAAAKEATEVLVVACEEMRASRAERRGQDGDVLLRQFRSYRQTQVHFFDDLGSPGGAAKMGVIDADHDLQIQVYTDAGLHEGLDMRGAYIHDLKAGERTPVDVTPAAVARAETVVLEAAERLLARNYAPDPGKKCRTCEVRNVCGSAAP